MAKSNRGGKRVAIPLAQQPTPQPIPQPDEEEDTTDTTPEEETQENGLPTADAFKKMSDDEKADAIAEALKYDVPDQIPDNSLQRLTYNILGINGKPALANDSELDSMSGKELFRTVHSTYDPRNDVNYTAKQIAAQVMKGANTNYSDSGGSAYGRGIYFARSYGGSAAYRSGNVANNIIMRAKITSGNGISSSAASAGVSREIASGTKLGRVLSRCDSTSRSAVYALAKGYAYMHDGYDDYYVIIDRSCLTMSNRTKIPTGSSW